MAGNGAKPFRIDSIPNEVSLYPVWKFHIGDNAQWAAPSYDDNSWDTIYSDMQKEADQKKFTGSGWFRLHLKVAPSLFYRKFVFSMEQAGASEVYFNGKRIFQFGTVSGTGHEVAFSPRTSTYFIEFGGDSNQVIVVRYSAWKAILKNYFKPGFTITLEDTNVAMATLKSKETTLMWSYLFFAMFFTFGAFHFLLFLFHRKIRSNLYYSMMAFILSVFWLYPVIIAKSSNPFITDILNGAMMYMYPAFFFFIVILMYTIFQLKFGRFFWIILGFTVASEIGVALDIPYFGFIMLASIILSSIESIRIAIKSVKQKKPGAWIIATGFMIFVVSIVVVVIVGVVVAMTTHRSNFDSSGSNLVLLLIFGWALSIPTSMSIYLASDFARTSKSLALQLVHVKQLAEQNIEKEREKQQIIEGQKEVLVVKVKEATAQISLQKDELEEKNKEITDSINYARRIQTSILPDDEQMKDALGDYLLVYKPKDVVSGDFYWCHTIGDKTIFAVADCTGHGVPGAFMSMIGNSILNAVVLGKQITEANTILDEMRSLLITTLQQSTQHVTTRDGMDIALCVWNRKDNTLQFAGANNSLYLVSKNIAKNVKESGRVRLSDEHLLEILPDKQPIGYQEDKMDNPFTKNIIELHKGDCIFISSDGYTDQFGGEKNKKFTSKRFRQLLASMVDMPVHTQKQMLDQTIEQWRRLESQTDDICVVGIRV